MSSIEAIAERKRALVERSAGHRNEMTRVYYEWQARTRVARQVTGVLKHPLVLTSIGLLLLKMPWRRAYKMSGWAWKGWRVLMLLRKVFI